MTATRQFSYNEEDEDLMPLQAFLSHAALEAGEGQADTWQDAVQLMTLHSAKGLEFPQVFIVGMEEGMFPSQMSLDEGGRLEEERRLAYVGVTRAMQKLTLTYAETRRLYGKEVYHRPSRFIGELPEECVEEVRLRATVSRPVSHQRMGTPMVENDSGYKLGQRVRHAKFGEGTIVNMEGSGEHSRLQVAFQGGVLNGWWRHTPGWRRYNVAGCGAPHRIRHQHLTYHISSHQYSSQHQTQPDVSARNYPYSAPRKHSISCSDTPSAVLPAHRRSWRHTAFSLRIFSPEPSEMVTHNVSLSLIPA